MKQIITLAMLCVASICLSQSTFYEDDYITVYGYADPVEESTIYKTDVTLSIENNYYNETCCNTLEELKKKYFAEAEKLGIDISKFELDEFGYDALGYRKPGAIYRFETDNKEEILNVRRIKLIQAKASYVQMKIELSDKEIKRTLELALEDAEKNATVIAKLADRKLDEIKSISSYEIGAEPYWQSINTKPRNMRLTVIYKLKK